MILMRPDQMELGAQKQSPAEIVTVQNMKILYQTLMGSSQKSGYYQDMGQFPARFPLTLGDLFMLPTSLPVSFQSFNPFTQLGWRGSYLSGISTHYGEFAGVGYVFRAGFGALYGNPSDPAVLDGWGNPIVLQSELDGIPGRTAFEVQYARLVSAGSNGILETPVGASNISPGANAGTELTLSECGDDLVLFLQSADLRQ
jgi:hypothetical protein